MKMKLKRRIAEILVNYLGVDTSKAHFVAGVIMEAMEAMEAIERKGN